MLRRTDKGVRSGQAHKGSAGGGREHTPGGAGLHGHDGKRETLVGLVVAKADCLVEDLLKGKKKQPRQNRFGEVSTALSLFPS